MLLTDPLLFVPASVKPEGILPITVRHLTRAWREHCRLLDWNRDLPRPAECRHVSSRVWRRHSALLCLRSGNRGLDL
jgi:hypothetical protein